MILKKYKKTNLYLSLLIRFFSNYPLIKKITLAISIFFSGIFFQKIGVIGDFINPQIKYFISNIKNVNVKSKTLIIDIKHNDFQKIIEKRNEALSVGHLKTNENDYVPAKISVSDSEKKYKVKIRLKGDQLDHLTSDKWSFRIKVKDNTIWGMSKFSLHHPKERNYIWEYIYHKLLKEENLVSLRYDFVRTIINGKDYGIYAVEEHFTKYLIENSKMRDAPIIKYSESSYRSDNYHPWGLHDNEEYQTSLIDAFQMNTILKDSILLEQYNLGVKLLDGFRNGNYKTSDVFDIEKLSRFIAISDLTGADHGMRWNNKRFYLNPITRKLEPIGFDGMPGYRIVSLIMNPYYLIRTDTEKIFMDDEFLISYLKCLNRISNKSYITNFLQKYDDKIKTYVSLLKSEFIGFQFEESILDQNQKFIKQTLNPKIALQASFEKVSNDSILIKLINKQTIPINITKIFNEVFNFDYNKKVNGKRITEKVIPQYISLPISNVEEHINSKDLSVQYTLLGQEQKNIIQIKKNYDNSGINKIPHIFSNNELIEYNFVLNDKIKKQIIFKKGHIEIEEDVIFPKDYKIIIKENTYLNLKKSSKIISYSPMFFYGNKSNKIKVYSSDKTGQGITIINADEESFFENVSFEDLKAVSEYSWRLTGAITLYKSDSYFNNCSFINNKSEDALNSINSQIILWRTLFSNNYSDDFDGDFVSGSIRECTFKNSGNDAIDISGSNLDIQDVEIEKFGDKGISLGENSHAFLENIKILDGEIGLANKDFSDVEGKKIFIKNCKVGITSFQKKTEYGPASTNLNYVKFIECEKSFLIEEGSFTKFDGAFISPNSRNLKNIFYGNLYGKKSY